MATDPRIVRSREAVLEAALTLLAERGFSGVSIDAISKASGVARTTIYRHWPSLGTVVYDAACNASPPQSIPHTDDPWADVCAFVRELADRLQSSKWGSVFPALVDAANRDQEIYELQTARSHERRSVLVGLIERSQAAGQLDSAADSDFLAEILSGPIFARQFISHLPLDDAFVERLLAHAKASATP